MAEYATPATELRWPNTCAGSSCGACCERISTRAGLRDTLAEMADTPERGGYELAFIADHWSPHPDQAGGAGDDRWSEGRIVWTCDQYDAQRHLCMAGDARPRICSAFPHYERREVHRDGLEATVRGYTGDVAWDCSFAWALAPAERRGMRPLLPLVDVTGPHGR